MLGDVVKLTVVGKLHGQEVEQVMHFKGGVTSTDVIQLINDVLDCLRTTLWPALSPEYTLVEVRAKKLYPTATDEVVTPAVSTDHGTASGESLPSFCAAVVAIKTGLAGRTHRGRNYWGGIPEGGAANSLMTGTEWGLVIAFAACLAGKFIGLTASSSWTLGVLSRKLETAVGGNPSNAFTAATNLTVSQVIGTQRRRKLGVGS